MRGRQAENAESINGMPQKTTSFFQPDACAMYHGNSMRSVFRPGDILIPEKIDFKEIRPGDILAMRRPDGTNVVHRAIGLSPEGLWITQGDNNLTPDREKLSPGDMFARIPAVNRSGSGRLPIRSGEQGLREFRRHQRQCRIIRFFVPFLHAFLSLAFWRIPLDKPTRFGQETFFYYKKHPVAKLQDGKVVFLRLRDRLFFRIIQKKGS